MIAPGTHWLTITEAAHATHRTPATIRRWIRAGQVTYATGHGATLIDTASLLTAAGHARRAQQATQYQRPTTQRLARSVLPSRQDG